MNKSLENLFGYLTEIDARSKQFLMKALETNNLPGFDYLEFKQSLVVLANMNMDEATAVKSAFATASTMGLTKEKLLQSTQHYKEILHREKGQFDVALKKHLQQKVGAKIEENKRYELKLKQIQEQIERLQKETETIHARMEENNKIRETEGGKLSRQKDNFEQTYDVIRSEMDKDLEKFQLYL